MKDSLKYFLERNSFLGTLARLYREQKLRQKYYKWQNSRAVGPMPDYGKQQTVIEYIKRFNPQVFIETGTYKGKMVYAVIPHIKEIYSIEFDEIHCRNAQKRFAGYSNIHIIQGQSGEILPKILKNINKPCLFWLDAHYSGGSTAKGDTNTPIMQELQCMLNHNRAEQHIILIDDARLFIGENDYPTLEKLERLILGIHPRWTFEVKDDIIRVHSNKIKL